MTRRSDVARAILVAIAIATLAGSAAGCRRKRDAPRPSTETPLALLARPLINGGHFDVSTLAGKVVLVNFWSPG